MNKKKLTGPGFYTPMDIAPGEYAAPTPDQPTGMNELREALNTIFRHHDHIEDAQDLDLQLIQQLVERSIPPETHSLYRLDSDDKARGFRLAIDQFRHNLQQAGLLSGDDVTEGGTE